MLGTGLALAALLLRFALDPWLHDAQQLLTLYGMVALSVWLGGWAAATLTSIIGYLLLNYFITPPRGQFVFDSAAAASAVGAWLSCGVIIWLAEESRRARRLAYLKEEETAALLRRHERLAAIVESSSDAIVSIDLQGVITSWNRGAETLYGYSAAEAEGQKIELIVPPERTVDEQRILHQVRSGVILEHYETLRRRKDGSDVQIALTISPIRDASGKIIGASKSGRDITRRKQAELALQRSETKLRTALDAGKLAAWEWDIPRNQVTWTEKLYEFHGLAPGTFAGTVEAFSELVHPADRPRVEETLQRTLQSNLPYQLEFRTVRPDGQIRWLVTAAHLFRNELGKPERMVGVTQDITERLEVQQALQQSEARFRGLMEQAPLSIQILSPTGHTVRVNRAWEELWGLRLESLQGYNVLHDRQLAAHGILPYIQRAFAGEAVEVPEIRYDPNEAIPTGSRNQDPARWVTAVAYPLKREDGSVWEVALIHQDITTRRRAEEAVRASEERLRLITDNTPALVSYLDTDLRYQFANATYYKWFNRTSSEVIGTHARDLLGPEIFRQREPYMREALAGRNCRFEGYTTHHLLGLRHTEIVYVPDFTSSRAVRGFYVFVHDIHDRKVTEQSLQTALSKLQAHFNNSPLAVVEWNEELVVIQWSQGAEKLFGIPSAEALGQNLGKMSLVYRSDLEHVAQVSHHLLSGTEPFVLSKNRNLCRDGRILHCEWYNTVVRRNDGGISILSLVLDVTDRTRVEEALRESEARFRQLADVMPQLVWTAHSDGTVDYYNDRVRSYFGVSRDAQGHWQWQPMLHPDDLTATTAAWQAAVTSSRPYNITHRVRIQDGSYRWHLSRALPVRNSGGEITKWFGTATDIDDQKRAEEKLESVVAQRTAKLRETVAELEAFSYSIAHDMRAPLRSMSGYATILLSDYADRLDADAQSFLRRIEGSAERLDRLIQDVLNYSKIVRGEMDLEPVNFGQLAEEIIFSYSHLQEPHASISLEEPLPTILGNPAALTQVISNLLGNAVKFVSAGSKPKVRVHSEPGRDRFIRFWFEDNGIGIDPSAQQRIFQMFQRLNSPDQYEGTGIGLSIVRKAAEKMGGRVGLESIPGQGSRFWVELKAVPAAE